MFRITFIKIMGLSIFRCERAMLMLLHETSQGTFSHVFDLDSTELDEMDKDNPGNTVGRKNYAFLF